MKNAKDIIFVVEAWPDLYDAAEEIKRELCQNHNILLNPASG